MKKLKLFFVAMLLSAVAINSNAYVVNDVIDVGDGFTYRVVTAGSTYTVAVTSISLTGDVVIPSEVFDGKDVTFTVTELACGGGEDITSITFPNTLTTIGDGCSGFKGVSVIHFPASLTDIYYKFWEENNNLEAFTVDENNPKYAAEDGILYAGASPNKMTTLISIPQKKHIVGSDGSYSIREGVKTLRTGGADPFYSNIDLEILKTINIPSSLTSFPYGTRDIMKKLEAFVVDNNNQSLKSDNGVLLTADGTTLLLYPLAKPDVTYTVPDGVTTVEDRCFYFSTFTTLNLNDVTELKTGSIRTCNSLTSISLENVTTMGTSSINSCPRLTTITIPATLTEFNDGAIVNCDRLAEFIVEEGNPNYSAHNGVLYSADKKKLLLYPKGKVGDTYTIPAEFGVKEICTNAFKGASITSITIPNTVETIGVSAFEHAKIKSVDFETPISVTTIQSNAFNYAESLESFTWPESVNVIPVSCFIECHALKEFVVPDNVTDIKDAAFQWTHLETVKIGKGVINIENRAFYGSYLTEVIFDEKSSVTKIKGTAFQNQYRLTSVTLPSSLPTLETNVFVGCTGLKDIIVPDGSSLTTIKAFGAPNLERFTFEGSSNVTSIDKEAFKDHQKLTELHFPSTVNTIGSQAFKGCTNLESVTFEGGKAEIKTIGTAAFADCGLKSFDVPNKVVTIGNEAFRNCDVLTTVNLPAVTKSVDPQAFKGCSTLTAINVDKENETFSSSDGILLTKNKETLWIFPMGKANSNFTLLPPSITKIGNYAFYENENLTNVTIPNKVTTIGKRAFGLCKNLNTVTLLCDEMIDPTTNIAQALNEAAFDDGVTTEDEQFSKITLNVRKELLDDYQNNAYYQQFGAINPSFVDETSRAGGLNKTNAKEEFIAVSDNTVDLLSVDTNDETYVLPTSVEQGGKTYAVSLVGDYLFTANGSSVANVKEVVVPGNIEYIGARAFLTNAALTSTASTVESVFLIGDQLNEDLLSTARFELTPEDLGSGNKKHYDEFGTATKIYVRKSAEDTYKTAWGSYADNISYKIPFAQTGEYGTFAREFDVDFSEVNGVDAEKPVTDDPVVIAFTGDGKYNKNGNTFSVHMTSINLGDQTGKDGTYVPAGSGVLMKKYKDAEGEDGLYYQIAETGISEAFVDGNFMKGITLRPETIGAGDDVKRYYISGGTLHEMTKDTGFKNHKSYMELPADAVPAGAKVMLSFGNWDNEATGIESINANVDDNDNLYNLQGQRVNNAGKGIYIKNGKKIFVK